MLVQRAAARATSALELVAALRSLLTKGNAIPG
jgi:hypothetical protein